MAICQQSNFFCTTEIFARYRQLIQTVHLFHYRIFVIREKKNKNLPSSHFPPLHCGLHEQAKASFSLSNKQEPPFRHPVIRQPCRKSNFTWVSKSCFPSTCCSKCFRAKTFKFMLSLQCVRISQD